MKEEKKMESLREVWNATLEKLKNHPQISGPAFDMWIACIEPRSIEENAFVVFVSSDFQRNIIEQQYKEKICEALESVLQFPLDLKILCNEVEEEDAPIAVLGSNDEFTFQTFVVGDGNKFATVAAQAVANKPASQYNPLFIYGDSGLGKTHLLYAIRHEILKQNPTANVVYVTGEIFTNEFLDALNKESLPLFKTKYREADVLLIDDIQFIAKKERTQEEFFHTFDYLYQSHKQIVLTSDRPPKEISTLTDRLRSRFEWGLLADIAAPDLETRIVIIKRKAEQVGMNISNEVCEYIATQLKTNIRQLEGVVKKMRAQFILNGDTPSLASAQEAIRAIKNTTPAPITLEKVLEEVSRTTGVSTEDILSKKSTKEISRARQTAIKVLREVTTMSQWDIGKAIGRDHATIVYSTQSAEKRMKTDLSYRDMIEDIIKNLKSRE